MKHPFETEQHYEHRENFGRINVRHVHWAKTDGELVSLFSVGVCAPGGKGLRDTHAAIDDWNFRPADLRRLANSLNAAADSLEAHERQLAEKVSDPVPEDATK